MMKNGDTDTIFGMDWMNMDSPLPEKKITMRNLQADLIIALKTKDREEVRKLLEAGAPVRFYHENEFSLSVFMNNFDKDIAQMLVDKGADFSLRYFLPYAVRTKNEEMLEFLCRLKKEKILDEVDSFSQIFRADNAKFIKTILSYATPNRTAMSICSQEFIKSLDDLEKAKEFAAAIPTNAHSLFFNYFLTPQTMKDISLNKIKNLQGIKGEFKEGMKKAFPHKYIVGGCEYLFQNIPEFLVITGNSNAALLPPEKINGAVNDFFANNRDAMVLILYENTPTKLFSYKPLDLIVENLDNEEKLESLFYDILKRTSSPAPRLRWIKKFISFRPDVCLRENSEGQNLLSLLPKEQRAECERFLLKKTLSSPKEKSAKKKM